MLEFDTTFLLSYPLDQWQHLVQTEEANCKHLDWCVPCVMAM